jgi:hypothetical protein
LSAQIICARSQQEKYATDFRILQPNNDLRSRQSISTSNLQVAVLGHRSQLLYYVCYGNLEKQHSCQMRVAPASAFHVIWNTRKNNNTGNNTRDKSSILINNNNRLCFVWLNFKICLQGNKIALTG